MKAFDIGLSALRAQQLTLSVLGNNLANASTPGYHRQQVDLANRLPLREGSFSVGTGVDVVNVRRIRSDAVETALIRNSSEAGFSQQTQDIAAQVESLLTPGDSSIHAALSSFFNRLEKVANAPQDISFSAIMPYASPAAVRLLIPARRRLLSLVCQVSALAQSV